MALLDTLKGLGDEVTAADVVKDINDLNTLKDFINSNDAKDQSLRQVVEEKINDLAKNMKGEDAKALKDLADMGITVAGDILKENAEKATTRENVPMPAILNKGKEEKPKENDKKDVKSSVADALRQANGGR